MLDFLMESARSGFPTLPKLTDDDVDSIWASVSEFIEHQMAQQKGVNIPGLGTFTLSRHKIDVGNNKFILVQRPIFLLSEKFAQIHGLKYNKSFTTSDIPVVPLNFMALSFGCPFNRDTIEGCVKETLNVFSRSVATKQNVEFNFKGIGMLVTRDLKVKMRFYKDFINSLDGTGNLVKSLSNRPGTSDSVMSGRESTLLRPRSCSALIFPRVEVKDTEKTSPMDPIIEENGEVEWVTEGQKPNEKPEIEDEGERPNTCNRESSSTKRLLNRQCIVPAKVTGISLMEDLERIVKPKTAPARPSSSLSAHSNKADPEGDDHLNSVQRIRNPPSPVCQDHCRAGQELCYLCMQRAQKNIPVYFTEERRLKEQEEDRILQQYQHMKDQEALDKTQMESLATREQKQKDAAYNMGVAEAIRTQRNKRNTEIYRSYIFDKRPLTPPALIKQEQCFQSLVQQMTERRGKETKLKQDKELMDKLEQMQLAEEIAAQRAKYLKEKNEQMLCFKGALDTQVKLKPQFILSMGSSEAAEPVFGRHDMTNDKLAEKRRRAQEVSIHQLQSSTERKRLATLNELVQQRKEMEMLQKTKQELLSDRASQFEKMNKFQMTLQDNWARSLEVKKHKEQEEEKFIKSGSHLLLDQCEKYRRCLQCKRRTTNCGETNIWRESRYIPGSRLMV